MVRLLNWSWSASGRRYDLEAVDEGCVRIGGGEGFGTVPWNGFMFLSLDTCHNPDRRQILTIIDAPSLSHLSEHADEKLGSKVN